MLTLENLTRWGFTRVSWKTTHLKTSCVAETACSLTAKTPQPQTNRNSDRHLLILKIFCCKSFLTILISCQYQLYVHCVQLVSVLARLWFFFPRVSFSHSHNTVCIFIIITYLTWHHFNTCLYDIHLNTRYIYLWCLLVQAYKCLMF